MDAPALAADITTAAQDVVARMWARDHTVWQDDPTEVADRLGWLEAPQRAHGDIPVFRALVRDLADDGFTDALLVGMGGSSLYPEVLTTVAASPMVRLHVLDSTDPAAVRAAEAALDMTSTVLIPASKSGTTIEMACHLDFFGAVLQRSVDAPERHIVPITDPASALAKAAAQRNYRAVITGQPDVGGRFSALTPFGLLPATLLGIDPARHLVAAETMLDAARAPTLAQNDAARLGAVLAQCVQQGRDKLTIVLPPSLAAFGAWIEQLVAESTGKHGTGLLPVLGETPETAAFGDDRVLVIVDDRHDHDATVAVDRDVPVVRWSVDGPDALAGEVVRWEVATAVAGALLGINPFDQPDVGRAKDATQRALDAGESLPATQPAGLVLDHVGAGDYIALLGYVTPGGADEAALHAAADALRRRYEVPVTVGIGPRYLHSTGQFHKGGPDSGVFLIAVGDDTEDVAIPGRPYTFGVLKQAQAAGDLVALREAGRRVAHVRVDALV